MFLNKRDIFILYYMWKVMFVSQWNKLCKTFYLQEHFLLIMKKTSKISWHTGFSFLFIVSVIIGCRWSQRNKTHTVVAEKHHKSYEKFINICFFEFWIKLIWIKFDDSTTLYELGQSPPSCHLKLSRRPWESIQHLWSGCSLFHHVLPC